MATKAKEGVRLRDKNTPTSSGPLTDGRRAPRASITGSPDRDIPKLPEKPTPLYSAKPAVRSNTADLSKSLKPPNAAGAAPSRPPVRKPADKPPPPSSSQPQRQHTSQAPKEIRAPKTSSPSPRTSIPSRPIPDKASKTIKSTARAPPFTRARSPGNGPIPARRRETNTTTATAAATANAAAAAANSEPYASDDSSSIKFEEEETELSIHIDEHDAVDTIDIPPVVKEQVLDDQLMDSSESPQEEAEIPKDADVYHVDGSKDDKDESFDGEETEEKAVVAEDSAAATGEEAGDGSKPESTEEKATAVDVEDEAVVIKPVEVVAAPVVIRPEVRGRKEAQRSNEVIEECKSRFMEKRKNKVLALVGAFETVISLQEPEGQPQGKGGPAAEDGGNATKESAEST